MRKLPQKQNPKQEPSAAIEVPSRRNPPNHRRNRSRKRANKRGPHRPLLQRRVPKQISNTSHDAKRRRNPSRYVIQRKRPSHAQRNSEDQRLHRLQNATRQRPRSRPPHLPVRGALNVVGQRQIG